MVLIGASNTLPGLKARAETLGSGELLTFADGEVIRALDAITKRKPKVVALDRIFAVTPRGAALINRIKADRTLADSEIRVLGSNSDYSRIVPRVTAKTAPALDLRGTRRAPRIKIAKRVNVVVDGKRATLVDLSTVGAQVVSSGMLKPSQQVAVAFSDRVEKVNCQATTVWTAYETASDGGALYRAGLELIEPNAIAIDAFAQRHKA